MSLVHFMSVTHPISAGFRGRRAVGRSNRPTHSGLPPGVTDLHCQGPPDPFADASCDALWLACDPARQEQIAQDFVEKRADEIRDAVLDSAQPAAAAPRSNSLARRLLENWLDHRDRALADLHSRGLLTR